MGGLGLTPLNPSQAKKAGIWPALMLRLAACSTVEALDAFERETAGEPLRPAWRAALADQIELTREALALR